MKQINLVFAVHNHQPIGNFDSVFEEAYQQSYKPFLDVLEAHPSIRFTQHWTGPLLAWLVRHHPEFIARMKGLVAAGQLELLTGAYYEAVLAIIPPADRVGQIRKLTDTIVSLFGFRPRGMWLAERVWEPTLVPSLVEAGVEFVVVDDTHFKHAGFQDDQLTGYYITEDLGRTLNVIPIDKTLRYTLPFRPVEETIHYVQQVASDHVSRTVVHADDGEKFGVWPKTYQSVYADGWLEAFCSALEEHALWMHTVHMASLIDGQPPLGRVYLPTASYAEMLKWVLPPTAFLRLESFEHDLQSAGLLEGNAMFVRGGFWRNFLAKYPEANHMHKKMLRIADRIRRAGRKKRIDPVTLDHLWAGQCNDPYWHGVFGGLYLPNLRFPVYRNLLEAERRLDTLEQLPLLRVEETDFDCDGAPEILVESDEMNFCFTPATGGALVELDFKPAAFNLLDILSRREEGYHRRLMASAGEFRHHTASAAAVDAKEEGLEKLLFFDWYRHGSFIDHFFGPQTTREAFASCRYLELGDFVNQPYATLVHTGPSEIRIDLFRDGALWFGERRHALSVRKMFRYAPGHGEFHLSYVIRNGEKTPVDLMFGVELCAGLMAGDAHDRYYDMPGRVLADRRLRSSGEESDVTTFRLVDEWLGIELACMLDRPAELWRFPIETVSLSEAGFERLYQGSVITPVWRITLEQELSFGVTQQIRLIR